MDKRLLETEIVDGRKKPTLDALRLLKKGDWLFTCAMWPVQFEGFDKEKSAEHWDRKEFTDAEWERFSKFDSYTSTNGASHSVYHCGLKPVSTEYALWFIENKCWELFEHFEGKESCWEDYENCVQALCKRDGIEYEGI